MTQKRKYNKKSDYWNSPRKFDDIQKAGNTDMAVSRLKIGEIGSTALSSIKIYSDWIKPFELVWPQSIKTYAEMSRDEDVSTALEANYLFVERAFDEFSVTYNKDSAESQRAAEFVEWCLKNMEGQTLREAVRNALTCKVFGFSVIEKVYTQVKSGEYIGSYKIQKLSSRPAETLDSQQPFKFTDDGREIVAVVQNITKATGFPGQVLTNNIGKIEIPRNKVMIFSYSATDANPFGISPLESVYIPWKEKRLISEYETVGVAKDMGGMPVLEVPTEILNRAAENPGGDEWQSIETLKENMANMHAGEQAYMILPSDPHDSTAGVKQYSISFKGIEGTGKQFDTSKLKDERKKVIYDRFGAGFLIMGNNDTGSYSLSDNKQTLHSQFIERDVMLCTEVFNKDLIPQLLALNGIKLSDEDMPVFVPGDVGDPDIEGNSKMIQRVVSVGALPMTAEVIDEILRMCGFKYRVPEEIRTDKTKFTEFLTTFMPAMTSRSGDGMEQGTTGQGTSKTVSGKDSSSLNTENAA